MHSQLLRLIHGIVWVVTALGALHVGLMALGYNMLGSAFLMQWAKPIEYTFGIAGALSLVFFVMHTATGCHSCSGTGSCCK